MPEPGNAPVSPASLGDAADGGALVEIEALPAELARPRTRGGVTLTGDAARNVRDTLGTAVVESVKVSGTAARAMESTYRLVPSDKTAKGIADGSLRWATAKKGDASVIVKNAETGRIAGNGDLLKVPFSPAQVLGPAAWEAMAMATRQHYLVEINDMFEAVQKGVDEVLACMDDEKRAILSFARRASSGAQQRLADRGVLSEASLKELRDASQDAEKVWHELQLRMTRHLREYRAGTRTAEDIEQSWAMLLHATRVLGECSAVLTAIPHSSVTELEEATSKEQERATHVLDVVRSLAGELHGEHMKWAALNADWEARRTTNPAVNAVRLVRRKGTKPPQAPIDYPTAYRARQIAAPLPAPAALLVTVHEDGSVEVAAEA